jgi:hypothetical protein
MANETGGSKMQVSFKKPSEGEQFSAYIGADDVAAIQFRQLNSGAFEIRQGMQAWTTVAV